MNNPRAIWHEHQSPGAFPRLESDIEVDVAVVGAGITGVTTALLLAREGKRVALIERGRAVEGETASSSAHLSTQLDDRYTTLQDELSEEQLAALARAARRAIDLVDELVSGYHINCGFSRVPGYLFAEDSLDRETLFREGTLLTELGFPTQIVSSAPLPFRTAAALRVERQAVLNPRAYVLALLERAHDAGVEVLEQTEVTAYEEGDRCVLRTALGPRVFARDVVFAAETPLTRGALGAGVRPFATYAAAFPAGSSVHRGIFCDTQQPYNYLRTTMHAGRPHWVVGGQDHREGDGAPRHEALHRWIFDHFGVRPEQITHTWSGTIRESRDGLPLIGRLPGSMRVYTAMGFGGTGITWGSLSAELLRDQIMGRDSVFNEIFNTRRIAPVEVLDDLFVDGAAALRYFMDDPKIVREVVTVGDDD